MKEGGSSLEQHAPSHESPVSPLKSIKNEVHNILSILRLTQYVSPRRFTKEVLTRNELPLTRKFQRYLQQLSALDEFEASLASVQPFLDVLKDPSTSGPITGEALGAVDKFVAYNLIRVDRPGAAECINGIADAVINCKFAPSATTADEVVTLKILNVMIDTLRCSAGDFLDDENVWAMVKKCYQISRESRASFLLRSSSENILQQLMLKVFASWTTFPRRQRVKSIVDSQNTSRPAEVSNESAPRPVGTPYGEVTMNRCLQFLAFLTSFGADQTSSKLSSYYPRNAARSVVTVASMSPPEAAASAPDLLSPKPVPPTLTRPPPPAPALSASGLVNYPSSPNIRGGPNFTDIRAELRSIGNVGTKADQDETLKLEMRSLGLTLLNVALETGGEIIAQSPDLVLVIQEHVCRSLLLNSQTQSLFVLSMTLRCIFNLFMYLKKHLKVQLEMFFISLHLKVASQSPQSALQTPKTRRDAQPPPYFVSEKRELALESLLEFCREPDLILELYENYDCDLRCTNLFQQLVETLGEVANPFAHIDFTKRPRKPGEPRLSSSQALVFSSKMYRLKPGQPPQPRTLGKVTCLHRLAFEGLAAVCKTLAFRCVWDTRGPYIRPGLEEDPQSISSISDGDVKLEDVKLEDLKRQKDWKRRLAQGAKIFNSEPKRCLPALQNLGLVPTPATPETTAEFLRTTPGLDLRLIGEYLAHPGEWNGEVREAFVSQIDFAGVAVVEALRVFLSSFSLPGEAQQIERILETFSTAYYVQQAPVAGMPITEVPSDSQKALPEKCRVPRWVPPDRKDSMHDSSSPHSENARPPAPPPPFQAWSGCDKDHPPIDGATVFLSSDTAFVLAYSIILLNTDLHNSQVKKKMTREGFLKNNKGINEGKDLPAKYLDNIYTTIKHDELSVVTASSESCLASLMVENREFWDYLLRNSSVLGDYSSTLAAAAMRTPLQSFHHKAMFMILIEDVQLLRTLTHVYTCTRDPQIAVECMGTFGDIIRIASFYKVSDVLIKVSVILLNLFQPILSFKSQLVIPVLFHLFSIASHQLGYRGWTVYMDFINRLAVCGLVNVTHDSFPVSLRDSQVLAKSVGALIGDETMPFRLEDLSKLMQPQNSHWFSELTALLFSAAQPGTEESEDEEELVGTQEEVDSDNADDDYVPTEAGDAVVSSHMLALQASLDFWQRCMFFPHELSPESNDKIMEMREHRDLTSEKVLNILRLIIKERCQIDDFLPGRLRSMPLGQCNEFFCAMLDFILPSPAHQQEPLAISPQSSEGKSGTLVTEDPAASHDLEARVEADESIQDDDMYDLEELVDVDEIRYVLKRDEVPLMTVDAAESVKYARAVGPATALDSLSKLALVLNQRRDQARRRSESLGSSASLNRSQPVASTEEVSAAFYEVFLALAVLLEHLLLRYADTVQKHPHTDLKELRVMDILESKPSIVAPPDDTTASPRQRVKELIAEYETMGVDQAQHFNADNLKFLERVVVTTLKLCLDLGHYSDVKIMAPLTRLFDLTCKLKSTYLLPLYFQISSVVSILLNPAIYSSGLQRSTADMILAVDSGDGAGSKAPSYMPAFYTSVIDLVQRVSPWAFALAAPPPPPPPPGVQVHQAPKSPAPLSQPHSQSISQSGLEVLCTMCQSPSFQLTLSHMLRLYPRLVESSAGHLAITHFMQYLTQAFLMYCLPPSAPDSSVAAFDLEDTGAQGSPPSGASETESCVVEQTINLIGVLYNSVVVNSLDHQRVDRSGFTDTPSTDDDEDDTPLEAIAVWQLWAPVAQTLAMLSAFGTRNHRRHALMSLQHHLNAMPLSGDYSPLGCEESPRRRDACRWTAVVEYILFPLMSQHFIYPFPALVSFPLAERRTELRLGDNLLSLFPSVQAALCQIPKVQLIHRLMESPINQLPPSLAMQRKAQSVGFVCRGLLGKLDLLFEESEWPINEGRFARCLFPAVIRVLRIFLHEMHSATPSAFDAVVEATKNFLLVLATAQQLHVIDDKERDWCLKLLAHQDPRVLVPEPKRPPLVTAEAILERYQNLFKDYVSELGEAQNKLFVVIAYLLDMADRSAILFSIFDVLVPRSRKAPATPPPPES